MKQLAFFLLFFSTLALGQNSAVFRIDSLPTEGVLLNKGWKFHTGDNPEWAKTDFVDSAWESIDPTKDIKDIPPFAKTGIGWLRMELSLSNDLQREQFTMLIKQYIASEIYLNGRLIYKFGKISTNLEEVLAYNPESLPVSIPLNFSGNQILAVRYAFQSNIKFGTDQSTRIPLLEVKIISSNDAFKQVRIKERHLPVTNTFRIGAYVILAFLYLAFFLYNSSYKAYLFFFLFAIFEMPQDILQFNYPPKIENFVLAIRVTNILWQFSQLFLLTGMYFLLNQKKGWAYWTLVILSFTGIILNNWAFSELLVVNLISLELVRTCFKSLKLKTRGSWIISTGAVCFLFFMCAFYTGVSFDLSLTNIKLGESYTVLDLLYGAGQLCIPIATTIYVALDFGFTNHALQLKLIEVEKLSQKTIAQEMEKQQLLSSQNEMLEKQVTERTAELNKSLTELKSTQAQLIQSEKMASLGELTAGIAHEIQNPLNFVNNFSSINSELIGDLSNEIKNKNYDEVEALAGDIKINSEKINHHGQRASSIVKSMLEHSRASSGKKEPTDINNLCDEFVRLSYHARLNDKVGQGLRAKDKDFNCNYHLDLDPNLPLVNVVSQDISRVILNLVNNAFQATYEKSRKESEERINGIDHPPSSLSMHPYIPSITVSTQYKRDKIEIRISDNGSGIPDQIKDKIFQPFFTTKPTGEGTGLGLSLAYDIIKAHGGEIRCESKPGDTSFIISIPVI